MANRQQDSITIDPVPHPGGEAVKRYKAFDQEVIIQLKTDLPASHGVCKITDYVFFKGGNILKDVLYKQPTLALSNAPLMGLKAGSLIRMVRVPSSGEYKFEFIAALGLDPVINGIFSDL